MQRQADRDHHQADESREELRRQAEEDRRKADQGWEEFRREAETDRRKADQDRKDFNKRMAELSDSMGTLVEDMVAPNPRRIAGEIFPVDPVVRLMQRLRQVHPTDPSRMVEIDLLAAGRQHLMVVDIDTDPPTDPALFSFTPEPGMVVDEQKWLPDGAGGVSVQKTLYRVGTSGRIIKLDENFYPLWRTKIWQWLLLGMIGLGPVLYFWLLRRGRSTLGPTR